MLRDVKTSVVRGVCVLLCGVLSMQCRTAPVPAQEAGRQGTGPILSTTIDFLDYCWSETDPDVGYFTEVQYEGVIRALANAGIDKVYLRVDACGLTLYPTKVGKQYPGDGREPGSTNLVKTLAKYDPVAKTIELCRKYGLQVWCWDTLLDDEATALRYDAVEDRAKHDAYGEYPLKDPFLIANPHLQWALDPRVKARQALNASRLNRIGPITAVRITSDSGGAQNRVKREQFELYVSADNRSFRLYDKPFTFKVVKQQPTMLLLEGLDISETYLKLAWKKPWAEDGRYSVCGTPKGIAQIFHDGEWHDVYGVFCSQVDDPRGRGGDFVRTGRFAWDWGNRALVIAKFLPPLPDHYGVIELAYPEAKAHKLAKLKELAVYDFDGFAYSMRTHTMGLDPKIYGYNDVIRDEYLRRHGKDIWKDDFDRAKWLDLRAEAVNEYLAMASKAIAPRPLYMDWPATGTKSPYSRRYGDFPFQANKWVQARAVSGVRVMSCPEDLPIKLDVPGADTVKLIRFVDNWAMPTPDVFRSNLLRWFANESLDEVELYETVLYTKQPAYLAVIREVMNEVQGKTKARGEETMQKETVKRVTSMEELREARKKAAHRKRRIIFNNDGNEPVYFMSEATPKAFLDCRTTALLGSQVDSIFYCTWSSGFGMFTHDTKVGEVFSTTVNPDHPHNKRDGFAKNKTAELIAKGIDPLKLTVDFCKQHRLEVFWSFRMNDTHDAWGSWYGEHLFPELKKDHPEWMVSELKDPARRGSTDVKDYNRSKQGGWTAMDFNHQEVRDLAVKLFEEVCENYDVDGIEMDFFRHPIYFKGPAWSKDASQDELDKLTDMARRIRKMTERIGLKRGRPILVGIRVPDSIDYCRAMGIDVERWLAEGLVDIMAVTGYFRLNPWSVSVDFGKRYGVPVYASLSETRIRDGAAKKLRASQACYRGRAAVAWGSGVDGIYMFNSFNPKSPLWRQLGDPEGLQGMDKAYVIGARGVRVINSWMKDGEKRFLSRPSLSPERPVKLQPGKPASVELRIAGLPKQRSAIEAILRVRVKDLEGATAEVAFNGQVLADGVAAAPWTDYTLDPQTLRNGANSVTVTLPADSAAKAVWMDVTVRVKPSTKWQGIPE